MYAGPHRTFLLACLVLSAAGACLALLLRSGTRETGVLAIVREAGREEVMSRRLTATWQVSEDKHRVVGELIAGRITLREAAAQFGRLDARLDEGNDRTIAPLPTASAEESLCRMVHSWVATELRGRPEAAAVLARLGAEYRERFGHDPELAPASPPDR